MDNQLYPEIGKTLQFRLIKIDEMKNYFVKEICERESMCKHLDK